MTAPAPAGLEKLKPCPFCGEDCGYVRSPFKAPNGDPYFTVTCVNCGAHSTDTGSEAEAIAAWNTRAPSAPTEAMEELRKAAENIANFAWSSIREVDCSEAADHLNKLLGKLRAALTVAAGDGSLRKLQTTTGGLTMAEIADHDRRADLAKKED